MKVLTNSNLKDLDDSNVTISALIVTLNLTGKHLAAEKMNEQLVLAGRESYLVARMPKKLYEISPSFQNTVLIT